MCTVPCLVQHWGLVPGWCLPEQEFRNSLSQCLTDCDNLLVNLTGSSLPANTPLGVSVGEFPWGLSEERRHTLNAGYSVLRGGALGWIHLSLLPECGCHSTSSQTPAQALSPPPLQPGQSMLKSWAVSRNKLLLHKLILPCDVTWQATSMHVDQAGSMLVLCALLVLSTAACLIWFLQFYKVGIWGHWGLKSSSDVVLDLSQSPLALKSVTLVAMFFCLWLLGCLLKGKYIAYLFLEHMVHRVVFEQCLTGGVSNCGLESPMDSELDAELMLLSGIGRLGPRVRFTSLWRKNSYGPSVSTVLFILYLLQHLK